MHQTHTLTTPENCSHHPRCSVWTAITWASIFIALMAPAFVAAVHAAPPPPHQLTLQCIRWHSGRLSVQDPHHQMQGVRPYRVVHKQFGPPLFGGTLAEGLCTLVREG